MRDLSLSIGSGVIWLLGSNGAGKTTLMLDFAGFFSTRAVGVMAMYAGIGFAFVATAAMVHRTRLA